jgi:hypothetical protein
MKRRAFITLLGGAAVLIGAGSALYQFLQQQQAAQHQQEAVQSQFVQQQKAAHDLLISNQVSKGFEQLASKEPVMRLGGIYALEGVMNTSDQYRVPVLEALCAFVRDNTTGMTESSAKQPATDIQAALTVIGRRTKGPGVVDLAKVGISGANLSGADLRGAMLWGAILERGGPGLEGTGGDSQAWPCYFLRCRHRRAG